MVKLTGMPEADIEKMLDDMSYTGLLEYNWENPERAKQWVLPMLVPGSAEFLNMRVSQLEEHPVYAKFFEQASKGPLSKATPMVPPGGAGIGMHVIPVEKAIDAASTSVPIEHIEHWLDKYEGKYAASTCSCRASRRVMGEGCADDPADWCIAVGDMADYVVETDRGHYVTRDEVYDILRQAEAAMKDACAVAFVVDGRDGLLPLDEYLAAHIRRMGLPTLCVVNKVDGLEKEDELLAEFHSLGFPLLPVSAEHGHNIRALTEELADLLPDLALKDGYVPATINYQVPDPACDLDIVPNEGRQADIKVAISDSLGFGGHNGSILLKKWEDA